MKKSEKRDRRKRKIRAKILAISTRPRVSVHRSAKHIRAQIIDDKVGKTLVSFDDLKLADKKLTKIQVAQKVGEKLGELAKKKKIFKVSFDRGGCAYHGRVKALAEGLRAAGLEF